MTRTPRSPVLRDVMLHAQPRSLARTPHPAARGEEPKPSTSAFDAQAAAAQAAFSQAVKEAQARGFSQGHEEGREAGLQQGLADAQARFDEAVREAVQQVETRAAREREAQAQAHTACLQRFDSVLQELQDAVKARCDTLEVDAVALAYAATCRIVGDISVQADAVAALVQHAIAQLRGGVLLRVRLRPADLQAMRDDDAGQALIARHPAVQWVADAQLQAAGCVLDTDHGSLDARLDAQLERLRALWLAGACGHAAQER